MQNSGSGARYGQFVAPAGGMQRLIDAMAARLPAGCVRLRSPVERIELTSGAWQVCAANADEPEPFDDVILSAPGAVSSRLLRNVDDELASLIGQISHAGCSVVVLGVRRDQVRHPLDGFGFVVPAVEKRRILAGSLASVKFPGRAPDGKVLLRVFIGGALQPELGVLPDAEIKPIVHAELGQLLGLSGEPEFCDVIRWHGMMPQYHVGHLDRVANIEQRAAAIPRFALAGNAYRGVGIPFCIRSGELAAEQIVRNAEFRVQNAESDTCST